MLKLLKDWLINHKVLKNKSLNFSYFIKIKKYKNKKFIYSIKKNK